MDEHDSGDFDETDDFEDVNEQSIARLRGYAEAAGDDEACEWLADCLAFCKAEAGVN